MTESHETPPPPSLAMRNRSVAPIRSPPAWWTSWRNASRAGLEAIAAALRPAPPMLAGVPPTIRLCRLPASGRTAAEIRGHTPSPRRAAAAPAADSAARTPPVAAASSPPPPDPASRPKRRRGRMAPSGGAALMAAVLGLPWAPRPFGSEPRLHADAIAIASLEAALERSEVPPGLRDGFRREIAEALGATLDLGEDKRLHAGEQFGHWLSHHRDRFVAAIGSDAARDAALLLLRRHLEALRDAPSRDDASRQASLAEEFILLEALLDGGQRLLPHLEEPMRQRLQRRLVAASEERVRRRASYFFPDRREAAAADTGSLRERVLAASRDDLMLRSMAARVEADRRLLAAEPQTARFRLAMLEMAVDLLVDRLAAIGAEVLQPAGPADERFAPPPSPTVELGAAGEAAGLSETATLEELLAAIASRRPAGDDCPPFAAATPRRSDAPGHDGGPP